MEIIAELEKEERGVYTGAIGYLAPDGQAVFNVPIRTVVLRGDYGEMGIGSGIIHDSDPEQEWRECLLKGRFLSHCRPRFELLETMLWQPDSGYWLLDEHLARMAGRPGSFVFPGRRVVFARNCKRPPGLFATLHAGAADPGQGWRLSISVQPCDPPGPFRLPEIPPGTGRHPARGRFFPSRPWSEGFPWLRHKTTRREVYDDGTRGRPAERAVRGPLRQ